MSIHDIQEATQHNAHIQELKEHLIGGLQSSRDEVKQDIKQYWTLNDKRELINSFTISPAQIQ